jgi:PKD repeat protein
MDLGVPEKVMYFDKDHISPIFTAQLVDHDKIEGPKADFEWDPENPVPGDKVKFTDKSTGEIYARLWEFGDKVISYDKNPEHPYIEKGTYTVNLTVTKNVVIPGTEIEIEIKNTTSKEIKIVSEEGGNTPGFEFLFALLAAIIAICNRKWRESRK